MAIIDAGQTYDYYLDDLVRCAGSNDTAAIEEKKQKIKDEIKKSIKGEVQQVFATMLRILYGSDYEQISADMAKLALVGEKGFDEKMNRVAVLNAILGHLLIYYGNSSEEFLERIKNPIRGLYL